MNTSPEFERLLKPMLFVPRVLWFALTFSILVYIYIAYTTAASQAADGTREIDAGFRYGIYVAAGVVFLVTLVVRVLFFGEGRLTKILALKPDPRKMARNQQTGDVNEERLAKLEALSERELKLLGVVGKIFSPWIAVLALNEALAIFGLILSFTANDGAELLPFAAAAIALNATAFNTIGSTVRKAERLVR